MKKTLSPLRYPGGKTKLYEYTKKLIEENNLVGCTYCEPFAGGCGLSIQLLHDGIVQKLILNDIDKYIYTLWITILNNSNELIKKIENTPVNIEQWYIQKEIQTNPDDYDLIDIAFSTLFLNRTNRSGILSAGPIGGYSQTGNYKIDCRFNKSSIIKKIDLISSYKKKIIFKNNDALKFISYLEKISIHDKKFVFLDPPYFNKGPELYLNFYKTEDHRALCERIKKTDLNWITTYDNVKEIKEMYDNIDYMDYDIRYELQQKKMGQEVMFFSSNIKKMKIA